MLMDFVNSTFQLGDALSDFSNVLCLKIKSALNECLSLLRSLATLANLLCNFSEVVGENLLNGINETVPLVVIGIDALFILREDNETVELLQLCNLALD